AERLMGRENYLCTRRTVSFIIGRADDDHEMALALALSVALCDGGIVASLPELPDCVNPASLTAPPRCSMNACRYAGSCPLIKARKRARQAGILLVNHALVMTDYRQGGTVLGPYKRVIFDEAHHLERSVMENLSVRASGDDVERILEPVWPIKKDQERWKFLLNELEACDPSIDRVGFLEGLSQSAMTLREAFVGIFRSIQSSLNPDGELANMKTRYLDGEETFADERENIRGFLLNSNMFTELLKPILEIKVASAVQPFQQELAFLKDEIGALSDGIRFLVTGRDEDSVFWLEWGRDGSLGKICGSPLKVDRLFADYLEETCETAVFTSATLVQGGSFQYFNERLGLRYLDRKPVELVAPNAFRYDENCLILLATWLGDPNGKGFGEGVAGVVGRIVQDTGCSTMVLFTSYRLCFSTAGFLRDHELAGPVLVQGLGESRETLSEKLRRSRGGVLLGVASFWEGVDFPGDELEILVIPKLPFPVPTEPIVQARSQKLRALGEDPFEKLFLPEAILRLRQGVGRLIRRKRDRGVVIILDSRLDRRPYGDRILSSMPSRAIRVETIDEISSRSIAWLK
ncbi:MAG: hypothetical protein KAX38_09705, partial [Candidatus Krumholzibacteria bacterium]|nr:hypothetical protein [Candidatus Krumholzibacteria bacterium]